jgi:excisionase family DNA binding protein
LMATQAVKLSEAVGKVSEAMEAVTAVVGSALDVLRRIAEAHEQEVQASDPGMSIKAVSAELGVSRASVSTLIRTGRLRAERHGKILTIPRSELLAYRKRASTLRRVK